MSRGFSDIEFVKIFRKMQEWEWYKDPVTKSLFLHCLLKANWRAGEWNGIRYEAGQFITSLPALADDLGISVQQVRTGIMHLTATGEIESITTDKATGKALPKCRIIAVKNWSEYQPTNRQSNREENTTQQQAQQQAEQQQKKKSKNNNIYIYKAPTLEEAEAYFSAQDFTADPMRFFYHHQATGWAGIKDWRAAAWVWNSNHLEYRVIKPQNKPAGSRPNKWAGMQREYTPQEMQDLEAMLLGGAGCRIAR